MLDRIRVRRYVGVALMVSALALALRATRAFQQPTSVEVLVPNVLAVYPHDENAWIQGLVWHEGKLYESTGLNGHSSLRLVDIQSGTALKKRDLSRAYFAEGLALVGDHLFQLTYYEQVAFVYDAETFEIVKAFKYQGQGWGLCSDGTALYMSNGSSYIVTRDPDTFAVTGQMQVIFENQPITFTTDSGQTQIIYQDQPVGFLNELECVGDSIYANIWTTDLIYRIDKATGKVTAVIDATDLLSPDEKDAVTKRSGILNGIAYNPQTGHFYLTGKFWPKLFEVELVPRKP